MNLRIKTGLLLSSNRILLHMELAQNETGLKHKQPPLRMKNQNRFMIRLKFGKYFWNPSPAVTDNARMIPEHLLPEMTTLWPGGSVTTDFKIIMSQVWRLIYQPVPNKIINCEKNTTGEFPRKVTFNVYKTLRIFWTAKIR